jgi:hypothetical protein
VAIGTILGERLSKLAELGLVKIDHKKNVIEPVNNIVNKRIFENC